MMKAVFLFSLVRVEKYAQILWAMRVVKRNQLFRGEVRKRESALRENPMDSGF